MKDSRAGSFAVIGLSLVLLLKFAVLTALPPALVPAALIAGHAVSRLAAVSVIPALDYVRGPDDARAGHVARGLSGADIVLASAAGLAPMALLADPIYLAALVPAAAVRLGLARHFRVRLGGYTGDCLGAVQQLTEVVFLLSILALWTSTSSVIPAST
jgi:adenosylcobinamide-GDP ribazoletransferase